jgi:hypothetical protein
MRRLLLCAALALAAGSAAASDEHGEHVKFQGKAGLPVMSTAAAAKAGAVLWASPASDKLTKDFARLFFQGVVTHSAVLFQASVGDGKTWGPWTDAALETADNGRFWARIEVSGKAGNRVKFRALSITAGVAHAKVFRLEAVPDEPAEAGGGISVPALRAPADGTAVAPPLLPVPPSEAEKPTVLSRKEWGAKKSKKPYEPMVPDRITVHHTEAFQAFTKEDAINELKTIQSFHQNGRGWIDIGYHFLIDGSGRIWEGRPLGVIGAHVRDKNDGNVGISLMGDFHPPDNNRPSIAQTQSLVILLKWLTAKYSIAPDRIKGHRDQNDTSCPGDILYAMLPDLRRQVSAGGAGVAGGPGGLKLPTPLQIQKAFGPGGISLAP